MEPETRALVKALAALNHKVPQVGLALMEGWISREQQREFAALLDELAERLMAHADGLIDSNGRAGVVVVPEEVVQPGISENQSDCRES